MDLSGGVGMEKRHGGDWAGFEREYGTLPLDFSVSVSPLGLPRGVRDAVIRSLDETWRYPDPLCRSLREKLATVYGLDAESIVCGNGAADLIYRLTQLLHPRQALITVPGFGEYRAALEAAGCEPERLVLLEDEDFRLPENLPAAIHSGLDLIFLCNPDNPSGHLAEPELLRALLARCRETGTLLVLDECFLDFTAEPERFSLINLLPAEPQLVILRAFTKTYAMAGLRLGYAICGDLSLARQLQDWGQPWAVSSAAQTAGLAALEEQEYLQSVRRLIAGERKWLLRELKALGFHVVEGKANYLLWRSERTDLSDALCRRGILMRSCDGFEGLDRHWLRTAVRTREENALLIRTLREVLQNG